MKLRLLIYYFRQALTNILNNRVVHGIGLSTMVISLLLLGMFLYLFVNLNSWIHGLGHSLTMSVYLQDKISDKAKENIAFYIKEMPGAEIKRYISKEEAFRDLRRLLGNQAGLIDCLSINPLPASFEIFIAKVTGKKADPEVIKRSLEKKEGVKEVQYSEEWLKRLKDLIDMVRFFGFIIGGFLCMAVIFVVANTIKLTIYSRKDEVEILKLVGATDWFVKMPFLLEGLLQGILGGALSLLILFFGQFFFFSKEMHFLGFAVLKFSFLPPEYIFAIITISMLVGLIGSLIALSSFFKV